MTNAMLHYTVSALEAGRHMVDVELTIPDPGTAPLRVAFPAWVPGHYMIEDFAGLVRGETATDASGKPLPMKKVDKATWEIRPGKATSVRFSFSSWAYNASVHHAFLDDHRMTLNGGPIFPWVEGRQGEPAEVEFRLPRGWKGPFTGMEPVRGRKGLFRVADYDELLDCPVVAGTPEVREFDVRGVPHYLVLSGASNAPMERLTRDVAGLTAAAADLFGEVPYRHYHYLVDLATTRGGGLEHRNSTHIMLGRWQFHPRAAYVDSLALFAHEFFHTWNVKRLRPSCLGPFDYTKEVQTPLLWFAEGVTSYYEKVVLRHAGVITPREFLDLLAREMQRLSLVPGRGWQTLEASSEETWIKFYKRGAHAVNCQVSYYNKGTVVGFLLDMELRARTKNRRSMDDLMRRMYERYYRDLGRGFTPEELEAEAAELAGVSLAPFFDRCLRSTKELKVADALAAAGLELANLEKTAPAGEIEPRNERGPISYLGIGVAGSGAARSLVLDQVLDGSPAQEAGLAPGDEIIGIDWLRMTPGRLNRILAENPPGTRHSFLVDRFGEIRSFDVVLGERPAIAVSIRPKRKATDLQQRICKSWARADWSSIDSTSPPVQQRERFRVG